MNVLHASATRAADLLQVSTLHEFGEEELVAGEVDRRFAARVGRALDDLATTAEIRGL
jgi:hypothetical protein